MWEVETLSLSLSIHYLHMSTQRPGHWQSWTDTPQYATYHHQHTSHPTHLDTFTLTSSHLHPHSHLTPPHPTLPPHTITPLNSLLLFTPFPPSHPPIPPSHLTPHTIPTLPPSNSHTLCSHTNHSYTSLSPLHTSSTITITPHNLPSQDIIIMYV